jgi:hypothetical protein
MSTTLFSTLQNLCKKYNLFLEKKAGGGFTVFTDDVIGIQLVINVSTVKDFNYYFVIRTHDIVYQGDRSDAHVILSLMFSSFLRTYGNGVSCSLFDIGHPVIADEIWGRYIMPVQDSKMAALTNTGELTSKVTSIIEAIVFWRDLFWQSVKCPCDNCCERDGIERTRLYNVSAEITNAIDKAVGSPKRSNEGYRNRPEWSFFYDIDHEVTIIKSDELSDCISKVVNTFKNRGFDTVEGVTGKLILDGDIRNYVSSKSLEILESIVESLFGSRKNEYSVIPMENMIVTVVRPYVLALGRLGGNSEFRTERELVRQRHNKESAILFPITRFEWAEKVEPDQFESLVKMLLEREFGVLSVRKPSPVNQPDDSRDLIIKWNVLESDTDSLSSETPPRKAINVVGQCKAMNKSVGKSKVQDIRDTLDTHSASGFFLAVSTQISAALTKKLESLRSQGIWTDWWNRDDIELRLSRNQDIIPRFPGVLKARHSVKFVDEDKAT